MRKRLLLFSLSLIVAVAAVAIGQTRLRRRAAEVSITDSGEVNLTPVSGQGVRVGNGSAELLKVLTGTASLNFGATAAGACDALTVTVTGAATGDNVILGIPATLAGADAYQHFWSYVSAANTVTVKRCNPTNATTALSDPAAATVRATVLQF